MLIGLGFAKHVADDGVVAFVNGGHEHGVVVETGENIRIGGIPGGFGSDVAQNL